MAKVINSIKEISLEQAQLLIQTTGKDVTYFLEGEPGIGKSSIKNMLEASLGDGYDFIYVDCPLIDLPDFAMPWVDQKSSTTHYAPSSLWQFNSSKPKVIMLDEVSKAPNVVKPMFTRLMLERCVGEFKLPAGSIVFATGNRASDGVGDTMQGHINNRVTKLTIGKPSLDSWMNWALNNGVNEMIILGVKECPHVLQSYTEFPENEYIFNPKRNTGAFVTPRSLAKAGFICANRHVFGADLTLEALKGTVGVTFALDLLAYFSVADSLPTWEAIEKNPSKTEIPRSPAAQLLLIFGSVMKVNKKNAAVHTEYFFRFERELRMLWARQFINRLELVMDVKEFRETIAKDHWVFN